MPAIETASTSNSVSGIELTPIRNEEDTLMEDQTAPRPGCNCDVCQWANARIERERRLDDDLAANYDRYLAGELVSKDGRE